MAYQTAWLVEGRVVYIEFSGVGTIEELREAVASEINVIETSPQTVHFINDSTRQEKITFGLANIKTLLNIPAVQAKGWHIVVTPHRFNRFIANIAGQFNSTRHREFATIEEAIQFLQEADDSVGEIPLPEAQPIP
jgi:hypothetical protein